MYFFEDEFSDEVFGVEEISAVTLDDSQLVTLRLESGNYLRFQPDTGAQCNVVPLHLYKKATKDVDLCNVTPVNTAIISCGGTSIAILGRVRLRVWRGDFRCLLDCNLVDSKKVQTYSWQESMPGNEHYPVSRQRPVKPTAGVWW